MKKSTGKNERSKKKARRVPGVVKWLGAIGVAALALYGVTQMSTVAYTDASLPAIDFSSLTSSEKQTALEAANRARCTCGCGMTLAQCVATDSTCPVREQNIHTIRTMVHDAGQP